MLSQRIYLASSSPRRRELLRKLGFRFRVIVPRVDESTVAGSPEQFAKRLAELKVLSVASRVRFGIIVGVDTIVVYRNRILGKPANRQEARQMLQLLSGRKHRVISGLCLLRLPDGKSIVTAEQTCVFFRRLLPSEIKAYVQSAEPYDKAGGYAIQGQGGFFVRRIEGDYFNVVGLPVARLLQLLPQLLSGHLSAEA